jgi:1-acyl-sn-glycerol-3-phosphate acyltransferase
MIAAPHTSNWDFPLTLAIARVSGVRIKWLGKASLFRGPMGPIMRWLGGVSIDRSAASGMVGSLADEFARRDQLVLVVPAEGTRSRGDHWKSGFYRIAQQADVPIVCAYVDSSTRSSGFGGPIRPTGDVRADMDLIRSIYAGKVGLKPAGTTTPHLREEDQADIVA